MKLLRYSCSQIMCQGWSGIVFFLLHSHLLFPQGTARRKKKVVHKTATADDKKLQGSLKKLAVNNIAGIEEVSYQRKANVSVLLLLQCFFCVCVCLMWKDKIQEEPYQSALPSCHLVYF